MSTRKFVVLVLVIVFISGLGFSLGFNHWEKYREKSRGAYIASLPKGERNYTVKRGELLFLPDGTQIRFMEFNLGYLIFLDGSSLGMYVTKDRMKYGGKKFFGDLDLSEDLRNRDSFGNIVMRVPYRLHILSADNNLLIYQLSERK